jgi:hypothetical protein
MNKVAVCTLWKLWKWMMMMDDALKEASTARYQMFSKKSK